MFFVYVIKSEITGILYKGMTEDLERRIEQHNKGYNKSTKGGRPWKLIYYEEFETRKEARSREKYFKSGVGREFIKKIMAS